MNSKLPFYVTGLGIIIGSIFVTSYLSACRFRFGGDGWATVEVEFIPGRSSQEEALRNFITAFSIFTSFQAAILAIGFKTPQNYSAKTHSRVRILIFGLSSMLLYFVGLFYSLTLILTCSLGGYAHSLNHFSALMIILGFGVGLTVILLGEIIGTGFIKRSQKSTVKK